MTTEFGAVSTERTQKFFQDLEAQRTILSSCTHLFTTLTARFASLQDSLVQKSQSLDSKFQNLESHAQQTLQSLSRREDSIPERESSAAAKIEEQRENALAEFENPPKLETLLDSLRLYSRRMDSSGLLRFIVSKRKQSAVVRAEIFGAVMEAVDPPRLVLDALEDFLIDKRFGAGVTDKRWACGMLVQALFPEGVWFGGKDKGPEYGRTVVERVAGILARWKEEEQMARGDASGGGVVGPAEAFMFLQLVVGFGLKSRFDEEFLRKLVVEHAGRKDMAKLAVAAGFGEKMGEIIDELLTNGKEIEAVYFASESGLTEKFPPVSLLKSYLKNSKKNATNILKNGKFSGKATEESNAAELNSIKCIIKCVEDNKLESEFSLDVLRKRATQLEKSKAEGKKSSAAVAPKPHNKRSHGAGGSRNNGPPAFRPSKTAKFSNAYSSFGRRNLASPTELSPAVRYPAAYNYPSQGIYEGHSSIPYASSYGVSRTQSPGAIPQQHYSVPVDNINTAGFHGSGSYGSQTNYEYGTYDYGTGAPSAYQPLS